MALRASREAIYAGYDVRQWQLDEMQADLTEAEGAVRTRRTPDSTNQAYR